MPVKSIWVAGALTLGLSMFSMAWGQAASDTQQQVVAAKAAESAHQYDEATRIWLPLAQNGLAEAQYYVGIHYFYGNGACENKPLGLDWLLKSANQGYTKAELTVGKAYYYGQGVARDQAQAAAWLQKAAENGDMDAQYELGMLYGSGSDTDYLKAAYWFQKSADQGHTDSMGQLGRLNNFGLGLLKDSVKAAYWYGKAAEKGDASSQNALAKLYEDGHGVKQDYVQAYKWYVLAATSGRFFSTSFDENMAKLKAKMTPAQIAEAEKLIAKARSVFPDRGNAIPVPMVMRPKAVCM